MTIDAKSEMEMIAAILAGDTQLFHQLILPYERTVYLMALSMMRDEADAEDVAQEAFLKAYRNLKSFRGDAKFSTWLLSIALNEARGRLRKKSGARLESLDETRDDGSPVSPALLRDWREIPSEAVERQEVRQMLQQAVLELPVIYREVIVLRLVEEQSVAEAAETLGISVASVKVRLHRARLTLQKVLAPQLKTVNPKRRWLPWL